MTEARHSIENKLSGLMTKNWQTYVKAWNAQIKTERMRLLEKACAKDSCYVDPNIELEGHEALCEYMQEFHQQMPEVRFELTRFICHHRKSIACWQLINNKGIELFSGVSYGTCLLYTSPSPRDA